jgi:serine/threonine protein kinase/WD40 repeat protein
MSTPASDPDLFNVLAYEFAERYRRGERPALNEYTERYPELAEEIRELFPTLVMMERLGSGVAGSESQRTGSTRAEAPIPERLGDFRIVREIGRGGMGIVYEAVQESLGRHVALKVLPVGYQLDPVQLKRFQREARAAALLHHTNIVPVFGVGEHEGVHYYAMQYIQGQSLDLVMREVIRLRRDAKTAEIATRDEPENMAASLAGELLTRGPSVRKVPLEKNEQSAITQAGGAVPGASLARAAEGGALEGGTSSSSWFQGSTTARYYRGVARAGVQAAEALDYAHLHGVLHRDIKPANLLLDLQGTVWVTDFGLAKAEGSVELTTPGNVVGTLRFMAPERFGDQADARSDVYSLGVTLYEMLTLKPAFAASERAALINAILHQNPARPRKHDRQIPRDLETIVLKAIAKNPADRFTSAAEMARELGRFVAGRPIHSRRASVPERLWRWARRNPAVALLSLLAATLTTVLAIGSTAAAWKFREQRDAVRIEQQNTTEALGRSLLLQARAMRNSSQPGRRQEGLASLELAARIAHNAEDGPVQLDELRDEVIATLALADDRQVRNWTGLAVPGGASAAFCVDADRYVVLEGDGAIHVYSVSDRSEVRIMVPGGRARRSSPEFVPGGRFVTVWADLSQAELWDLERGEQPAAWPDDVRCVSARPDGRQVAALRSDGALHVYNLPSFSEASRWRLGFDVRELSPVPSMSLSDDGRVLALTRFDEPRAYVFEVTTGRIILDLKIPSARVYKTLELGLKGRLLAVAIDRAIFVYDVPDGEQIAMLQGHQSEGITTAFQPGGKLIASWGWDGQTLLWDAVRGRLLFTATGVFQGWVRRGSALSILQPPELSLHHIVAAEERRTIDCRLLGDSPRSLLFGPARVAFSPDGQLIAMALRPDGVRIARTSDGAGLAHLPIGECDEVLFLRDGTLLTFNVRGLCRWPVRRQEPDSLRIGPPKTLALIDVVPGDIPAGLATDAIGRLVGLSERTKQGVLLLDPEQPWRRTWLMPHEGRHALAISPNGRWAATGGAGLQPDARLVKVWDTASGKLLGQLNVGIARVAFSPDSQWLGVGGADRYRLFRTGSWAAGPEIPHRLMGGALLAFHPSSKVIAIRDFSPTKARLADVESGRVLASFDVTDQTGIHCLEFSPDGRFLAAAHSDQRVDLWDLALIRRRLDALGLAAGMPDIFGGPTDSSGATRITRIEVVGADAMALELPSDPFAP